MVHLVAFSASAGAVTSWLTPPLDMTKLRIQVQRGNVSAPRSSEKVQGVVYIKACWTVYGIHVNMREA